MSVYYNELDPYAAQWLRNLIAGDQLPAGEVDERDVRDVRPGDLVGFAQCHFFAGIGGWAFALALAGYTGPVWTGSCPCQDFSLIGKRAGFAGNRDMWPEWFRLIRQCRPDRIFGEQVDGAPEWHDRAASDLESLGYACGAAVIPALAAGAQHERLRLYFGAHANAAGRTDAQRIAAAEAGTDIRASVGLVGGDAAWHFRGPIVPDRSWIVDGISGEGHAVGAYGNAIVPQITAEFIAAFMSIA